MLTTLYYEIALVKSLALRLFTPFKNVLCEFQQCIHGNVAPRSKHTTKLIMQWDQSVHIHLNPLWLLQAFVATRHANYFTHGKCTVAAVHNLSVQVLPLHRKGMRKSFGGHILGDYSWIEVLFYFNDSDIWRASQWYIVCSYKMYTTEIVQRKWVLILVHEL